MSSHILKPLCSSTPVLPTLHQRTVNRVSLCLLGYTKGSLRQLGSFHRETQWRLSSQVWESFKGSLGNLVLWTLGLRNNYFSKRRHYRTTSIVLSLPMHPLESIRFYLVGFSLYSSHPKQTKIWHTHSWCSNLKSSWGDPAGGTSSGSQF